MRKLTGQCSKAHGFLLCMVLSPHTGLASMGTPVHARRCDGLQLNSSSFLNKGKEVKTWFSQGHLKQNPSQFCCMASLRCVLFPLLSVFFNILLFLEERKLSEVKREGRKESQDRERGTDIQNPGGKGEEPPAPRERAVGTPVLCPACPSCCPHGPLCPLQRPYPQGGQCWWSTGSTDFQRHAVGI